MCKILYSEFSIILEAFWQGSERLEAWQQCCDESYRKVRKVIHALVAMTALVWCPLNTSVCPRTPIRPHKIPVKQAECFLFCDFI